MVDIRGLDRISISDGYPLPFQEDIFGSLRGANFITVVDSSGMFHLFLVKEKDRHKFTVVSHRGA